MKNNFFVILFLLAQSSFACDPCALYNAWKLQDFEDGQSTISLSEQFTEFDSNDTPQDGEVVKTYSVTQLGINHDFSKDFGAQISIPFITRDFDNYQNYRKSEDSEFGVGDISILANYVPYRYQKLNTSVILMTFAGIKLATGDTNSLDEISADGKFAKHHTVTTASGGRALTLGTGSTDYIVGTGILARKARLAFMSNLQYTIRTEGDYDYEFTDDLIWDAGPAYYALLSDTNTLAFRLTISGENKALDHRDGELVADSKINNLYLGPQILATFYRNYAGELSLDLPVSTSADSSIVPDYRIRTALSVRF